MTEDVATFLRLYDSSPTLVLFENVTDSKSSIESSAILKIAQEGEENLNPIEVVLESLINVVSEDISRNEVTHSTDTVLINRKIRDLATKKIISFINNDRTRLEFLHQSWLRMLVDFLRQLYKKRENVQIDEVIFEVGSQFRISSLSAVKALSSVSHVHA